MVELTIRDTIVSRACVEKIAGLKALQRVQTEGACPSGPEKGR